MSFNNNLGRKHQTGARPHSIDFLGNSPNLSNNLLKSREVPYQRSRNASFEDRTITKSPEFFEVRLEQLTEKLCRAQQQHTSKLQALSSSLDECSSRHQSIVQSSHHSNLLTELTAIEKSLTLEVTTLRDKTTIDHEEELERLKALVLKTSAEFAEVQQRNIQEMAESISSLAEDIEDVKISLDYQNEVDGEIRGELVKGLGQEVLKIEQLLNKEREDRQKGVKDMQKAASDIDKELEELISNQKKNRLKTESALTKVLETTFRKIEQRFRP